MVVGGGGYVVVVECIDGNDPSASVRMRKTWGDESTGIYMCVRESQREREYILYTVLLYI